MKTHENTHQHLHNRCPHYITLTTRWLPENATTGVQEIVDITETGAATNDIH